MIKSMTGYGRFRESVNGLDISVEIRSVNHRYFDLNLRLPKYYGFLEEGIRPLLSQYIHRGKVELNLFIRSTQQAEKRIFLNESLCENYIEVLQTLREKLGSTEPLSIEPFTRFNDLFEVEYVEADEEAVSKSVFLVLDSCLQDFTGMRKREGERMAQDLSMRLASVSALSDEIEKRFPQIIEEYHQRLMQKLTELLERVEEQRLLQEVALYADKLTTAEEIVRLRSHVKEFSFLVEKDGAVGKKLDFIVQEMNREANTIGSKCNDMETAKLVVELKSQIENIREQVQNIE